MEGFCEHTVCIYVRKFNKNGIEGLALKHSPGAPRLLTTDQEMLLAEVFHLKLQTKLAFQTEKTY